MVSYSLNKRITPKMTMTSSCSLIVELRYTSKRVFPNSLGLLSLITLRQEDGTVPPKVCDGFIPHLGKSNRVYVGIKQ